MNSQARTNRRNGGLPHDELAVLRAKLLDQRAFRSEQLAGYGGSAVLDEVHGQLVGAARHVLADVEAALDRMNTGHYGHCRACRTAIDLPRLRICPESLYCVTCHRERETDQ
ncbi:RNA polymerase-binding transcription factor DksA [Kribbella aluminosa]|uniref:RNA polymerase-binding transcription factor DksA n=1 Tax=Kribbella aluminosa TaxID=416017 RepID=A0ABS4UH72_9ACTN|nr:TraR/DksA C4-type zinc finger protein [Kribbella aluminosa]MBP2350991.1 RNA polymerase-binding transcription factor DksA [Kribbella aluminosa]